MHKSARTVLRRAFPSDDETGESLRGDISIVKLGKNDAVGAGTGILYVLLAFGFLFGGLDVPCECSCEAICFDLCSHGLCIVCSLVAETSTGCFITADALGEKGTPAEDVGERAATELVHELQQGGCVDEYIRVPLVLTSSVVLSRVCCLFFRF